MESKSLRIKQTQALFIILNSLLAELLSSVTFSEKPVTLFGSEDSVPGDTV